MLDKIRLLYVGRISAEKGIFNFIKIFEEIKTEFEFSIVGNLKKYKLSNKKINLINYVSDTKELINISQIFLSNLSKIENLRTLPDRWKPLKIGPFVVTTYPVDHSAPDAVAIEVEAEGKKVQFCNDTRPSGWPTKEVEGVRAYF